MTNEEYWAKRAEKRMIEYERSSNVILKKIYQAHNRAVADIDKDIQRILGKFAKDGDLTLEEAEKLLNAGETKEIRDHLKSIVDDINDPVLYKKTLSRINAPAYAYRISRLQALKDNIYINTMKLAPVQEKFLDKGFSNIVKTAYDKTIFDIQQRTGLGFSFATMNAKKAQEVLKANWSGKHYSKRIWGNTEYLAQEVERIISAGIRSGKSTRRMSKELQEKFEVSKHAATRLVRTETCALTNMTKLEGFKEAGVIEFRFLATLDRRTSELCQEHDNRVYLFKNAVQGKNVPPLHPNCRSIIAEVFDNEDLSNLERRARDPETGQTYLVPADMSYKEWKEHFDLGFEDSKEGDTDGFSTIIKVSDIDYKDKQAVKKALNEFVVLYGLSTLEYARVISPRNKVYDLRGTETSVNINLVDNDLRGSMVIHNHPPQYVDSFSKADIMVFFDVGLEEIQVVSAGLKNALRYSGKALSVQEVSALYEDAKLRVFTKAMQTGVPVGEMEQLEIVRELCRMVEGLELYEL